MWLPASETLRNMLAFSRIPCHVRANQVSIQSQVFTATLREILATCPTKSSEASHMKQGRLSTHPALLASSVSIQCAVDARLKMNEAIRSKKDGCRTRTPPFTFPAWSGFSQRPCLCMIWNTRESATDVSWMPKKISWCPRALGVCTKH